MAKQPKILRLCSYPTDRRPGMGLAVYELADMPGFNTTIYTYRPGTGEKLRPLKSASARLVPLKFASPEMPRKRSGPAFLLKQVQRLGAIVGFNSRVIIRSLGTSYDIVHIHSPMHALTGLIGKMRGAITCLTIHGTDFSRIAESSLIRASLKPIDVIFCMTHAHQRQLREWFPAKHVVYVANGTDIEYFSKDPPDSADRRKQIVGVGTLRWHKNFAALLRSFAALAKKDCEWRLTILGEGSDRQSLTRLADEMGIADRVSLPGAVSREHVRDALQQSAIFVLPSVTEGIPKALLEAMAAGCACIATDVGDCREVLGASGLIVPPADDDRLTGALLALADSQAARHRLSKAAVRRSRNYTWSAYAQKHAEAYREVLEERRTIAKARS